MKSIRVSQFGEPEVMRLEEVADLQVNSGQILVRVKAAGVNPVDTYIRSGNYARKPDLSYTPGSDAAGIIETVGDKITGFTIGDRVFVSGSLSGTYAEFCVCDEKDVHVLPENVSFEQGAGVFVPYATAFRALFQKAKAKSGDNILVHGASGGVGIAALQFAKAADLTVIGTAGSEKGRELILREGAKFALDHHDPNYIEKLMESTDAHGVEIVLEMLANVNLQRDLQIITQNGRVVVIGNRGTIEIDPRLMMGKDSSVLGMSLFNAPLEDMNEIHAAIFEGLSNGNLRPVVGKTFDLSDAPQAHRAVLEGNSFGKIVLLTGI
ncbi:MAG: NADPH:quinone reductase [Pyrinomonadaceae bacterium]|nr:NADPH:quinone reductase [Pyrinomonadaceae bacterium]